MFESPQNQESEPKMSLVEKNKEDFGKVTGLAALAGIVGVSAFMASELKNDAENEQAYMDYIEQTFSEEDMSRYEEIKEELTEVLGDHALENIEIADKVAFEHKEDAPHETEFHGFEGNKIQGVNTEIDLSEYPNFVFTEEYQMYPQNWINGEIFSVEYSEKTLYSTLQDIHGRTMGDIDDPLYSIIVYNRFDSENVPDNLSPDSVRYFFTDTFSHESGHANDWESKSSINLLQRVELLNSVVERMNSENPHSINITDEGIPYWQTKLGKSKHSAYLAAKEYWADMCSQYFNNPQYFKNTYPEDFEIVDSFVKSTDPNFDILDPERGAFDPRTGQLRENSN